jgi:predicted ribosomally synthesized peptide with nif11-like leader
MSVENAKAFIQAAREDEALRGQLMAIRERDRDAAMASVISIGAEKGFAFTAEEFTGSLNEELSDEDLDKVAGGTLYPTMSRFCFP